MSWGRRGPAKRGRPEEVEQTQIIRCLGTLGATVMVLGTRRAAPSGKCPQCGAFVLLKDPKHYTTRQTEGVSDLFAFLPMRTGQRRILFVECKAPKGRLSPAQTAFRALCLETAEGYVSGGLNAVIAWLLEHDYLKDSQVPYYRLPASPATTEGARA